MEVNKIYTSSLPYDVTAWCKEKTENIVKQLTYLVELNESLKIEFDKKQDISYYLHLALFDATKLLAFSYGAIWDPIDVDLIDEKGFDGLEEVKQKYGLLDKTDKERKKEGLTSIVNKLKEYLSGGVAPNRTFIHELLSTTKYSDPCLDDILDKVEEVTIGRLTWDKFCIFAEIKVQELEGRIENL